MISLDFLGVLVYNASIQIKEMRFFGGQFMYQGYTLHQKLHQHTHVRILDNSRYDLVCAGLFLENARKCLIILENSRFLSESRQ